MCDSFLSVRAQLPSAGLAPFPIPYDPWIGTDQFDGREQAIRFRGKGLGFRKDFAA